MTIAHRTVLRIAAILALTAATTTAFAQSGDERRGFQEGYAAAQRDVHAERDERGGPPWARVRIIEAEYGARGAMCDARRSVQHEAERNRGAIHVGNQLCGDPAGGVPKHLRVVYRCTDSAPARVVARENETLRLRCR